MKKYYKIPMTERIVSINGKSLFNTLQDNYPDLYNRELGRVELTYGGPEPGIMTPQLEREVDEYNAETARLYQAMGVPSHIIGVKNDEGEVFEYVTGLPLETRGYTSMFSGRGVSQLEAYNYLDNQINYSEVVTEMFPKKEEPKSLRKRVYEVIFGKKDN